MAKRSYNRHKEKSSSRRAFLQRAAGTSLATVAGIGLLPRAGRADNANPFPYIPLVDQLRNQANGGQAVAGAQGGDAPILNFALTVERLEAAFYNLNGNKPYLTATSPVTNPGTTTPATTVPGTTNPGVVNPGVTTPASTPPGQGPGTSTGTAASGTTPATTPSTTPTNNTGTTPATTPSTTPTTGSDLVGLKAMVDEIRAHENAHVALLEQALGANAQPAPTFQNLDAPTLPQFLSMAIMLEDVSVSAYQGQLPLIQDKGILATAGAIMGVEGRHAGGLRAFRKLTSTAEGGDPNTMLTEDGQALNPARTQAQVLAIVSPFVVGGPTTPGTTQLSTTPGTTTPSTTPGTPTPGTTTPGTTPGTTTPSTTPGTTPTTTPGTTPTTTPSTTPGTPPAYPGP